MDRLSSLLPQALRKKGLHTHVMAGLTTMKARQWIAANLPQITPALHVSSFTQGVVLVEADHSIALQECSQRSSDILSFLQKEVPDCTISAVRVVRARS